MAKYGKCKFDGLKDLQKQIEKFRDEELEQFIEDSVKILSQRLLKMVVKRTPVDSGNLRRNWSVYKIQKQGSDYTIEIINSAEYASYVEYGHRQEVGRYVPAIGKKLKKGWVNGHFMLTVSEKEIKNVAPSVVEKMLQKRLGEIFK
ncbi:MAG: HK97 gp10 family phage protein [Clostridiales bacterium]|nr:HK97 gp10 family phage protein [Clostridiales bacterium]